MPITQELVSHAILLQRNQRTSETMVDFRINAIKFKS